MIVEILPDIWYIIIGCTLIVLSVHATSVFHFAKEKNVSIYLDNGVYLQHVPGVGVKIIEMPGEGEVFVDRATGASFQIREGQPVAIGAPAVARTGEVKPRGRQVKSRLFG